jgi:Fe2+ or Zn2+ uptake regulation protein
VIRDNGIGRCKAGDYTKLNKLRHKSVGLKITEDRIYLYNKQQQANGYVKITDLYDENNDADGTQVDVKIKAS